MSILLIVCVHTILIEHHFQRICLYVIRVSWELISLKSFKLLEGYYADLSLISFPAFFESIFNIL